MHDPEPNDIAEVLYHLQVPHQVQYSRAVGRLVVQWGSPWSTSTTSKESARDVTYISACSENRGSRSNGTPRVELPTGANRSAWVVVCRILKRYVGLFYANPVYVLRWQWVHFSWHTPQLDTARLLEVVNLSHTLIRQCFQVHVLGYEWEVICFPLGLSLDGECGRTRSTVDRV